MAEESNFKTLFVADSTLMAILTGGVRTPADMGPNFLDRNENPGAWSGDTLLPNCFLRIRTEIPDNQISDEALQWRSTRAALEVWLYDDRYAAPTAIVAASNRIYTLLESKQVADSRVRFDGHILRLQRDPELNDSRMRADQYVLHRVKL